MTALSNDIFIRFESQLHSNSDFNRLWIARNLKYIFNIYEKKYPKKTYKDFIEKYNAINLIITVNSFNFCQMIHILKNHIKTNNTDLIYIILHILKNGVEINPVINNLLIKISAIVDFDLFKYYEENFQYCPEIMMRIILFRIKILIFKNNFFATEKSFLFNFKENLKVDELKKKYFKYYNQLDFDEEDLFESFLLYNQMEYYHVIKDDMENFKIFKNQLIKFTDETILISNKILYLYYKILSYDHDLEILNKLINYKKQQAYYIFNDNLDFKLLKKMSRNNTVVKFKFIFNLMDNRYSYFSKFIYLVGMDFDFITEIFKKLKKLDGENFDSIFLAVKTIFSFIGKNEKILKKNFFVQKKENFIEKYSEKLDEFIKSRKRKVIETSHFKIYHNKIKEDKFSSVLNLFRGFALGNKEIVNFNMTCKNEKNKKILNLIGEIFLFYSKHEDDKIRHIFLSDIIKYEHIFELFPENFKNEILLNLILNMENLRWSYRYDLCKFIFKKLPIEYFLKLYKDDRVFKIRKLVFELCR